MQHQHHWNMVEPTIGHDPESYHNAVYHLEGRREFGSGHWPNHMQMGKQSGWTELPHPLHIAADYSTFQGPVVADTELQSSSPGMKQEQDPTIDCSWSPTLTNSSLVSNTPTVATSHLMPVAESAAHVTGVESSLYWPSTNQFYGIPEYSDGQTMPYWPESQEETSTSSPSRRQKSSQVCLGRNQHPQAEVQALLDRPRRVKTTAENAKFYCNECDKGFQRIYNLRSHSLKHEAFREKISCVYAGCNKSFDRKTDLGRHERSVHLHLREHKCVLCGSVFARKDTLVRHIEGSCSKRTGVDRKRPKD